MDDSQFLVAQNAYRAVGILVKDIFSSMVAITVQHNYDGQIAILSDLQNEANRLMIYYALVKPEQEGNFLVSATKIIRLEHLSRAFFRITRNIWYERNGQAIQIQLPSDISSEE